MRKPAPSLLILCGTAIAAAVSYDASVMAEMIGVSRYGGEGVVALTALALSGLFMAMGAHGITRQWTRASSRAAA